jgi:hypothetical protein
MTFPINFRMNLESLMSLISARAISPSVLLLTGVVLLNGLVAHAKGECATEAHFNVPIDAQKDSHWANLRDLFQSGSPIVEPQSQDLMLYGICYQNIELPKKDPFTPLVSGAVLGKRGERAVILSWDGFKRPIYKMDAAWTYWFFDVLEASWSQSNETCEYRKQELAKLAEDWLVSPRVEFTYTEQVLVNVLAKTANGSTKSLVQIKEGIYSVKGPGQVRSNQLRFRKIPGAVVARIGSNLICAFPQP